MESRNRTWINLLGVAVMLVGGAQVGHAATTPPVAEAAPQGSTVQHSAAPAAKAAQLREDMRKLWSDHVIWTRDYIVAATAGSPDVNAAATRLLKNQEDIGAAVAGFYGKAAGDKLTALRKQHIMIAVDLQKVASVTPSFHFVPTMTKMAESKKSWHGETGVINREMMNRHVLHLHGSVYHVAGPPAMVTAMHAMLLAAGVDEDDVRSEEFAGY